MENIYIKAEERLPEVSFDFSKNLFSLSGESYPEDFHSFYSPLLAALRKHLKSQGGAEIVFDFWLVYFNSSSSKVLTQLFDLLDQTAKQNQVTINWHHDEDDETIEELGEEFGEDLEKATFNLKSESEVRDLTGGLYREKMQDRLIDIGVSQLNIEHEKLLSLLLDVDRILAKGQERELSEEDWDGLSDSMNNILVYANKHFTFEESLMRKHGYPQLESHSQQHRQLEAELSQLQNRILSHDSYEIETARKWLVEWLFTHIETEDLAYKPFLGNKY
jgi:hemerythrin-like metal-binding protein